MQANLGSRKVTVAGTLSLVAFAVMLILEPWFEGAVIVGWIMLGVLCLLDIIS